MDIIKSIIKRLHREDFPSKWMWQSVSWDEIKKEILDKIMEIGVVRSIPTSNYTEVIEVNLPVKFYWAEDGFDGMSFEYPLRELFDWEQEMLDNCLDIVKRQ